MDAEQRWQALVEKVFAEAELPEIDERELEAGTYTNAQIAEKLRHDPLQLISLVKGVAEMGGDVATKRSILSFAVDMI